MRREGIKPGRVIAGTLKRQIETARIAVGEPEIEPRLAEFDLDAVYKALAPHLVRDDEEFRTEYAALREAVKLADAPQHRQWTKTDVSVFRAWYENRYPFDGESWSAFKTRVQASMELCAAVGAEEQVAIFTSATPIGLWISAILGTSDENAMRLAGACYNASVTTLRVHRGDVRLLGFNAIAHLPETQLRTFR